MKLCQNAHSMHYVCFADLQHMYRYIYLCDILLYIGNTGSCQINTLCSFVQNEGIPSLLPNVSVLQTLDLLLQKLSYAWKPKAVIIRTFRRYRTLLIPQQKFLHVPLS